MDLNKRFSNNLGKEYELFKLAIPYHDLFQNNIINIIESYYPNSDRVNVLEIGFGSGISSETLLNKNQKYSLVSIDNEPIMLNLAENKLKNVLNKKFILKTIDALTYLKSQPDNSLDVIFSVWVIHNIQKDERDKIIKEIYRVLKPGGIFVNGDKIAIENLEIHKEDLGWQLKQFDLFDQIGRSDLKREWVQHYLEDERPGIIFTETEARYLLEKYNFEKFYFIDRNHLDVILVAIK